MIQRVLAAMKAAREVPVHPVTAIAGAVCVVLGASFVQRYVAQQQAGLAHAWNLLRLAEHDARVLQKRWEMVDRVRDGEDQYPAADDLDPVGRGLPTEADLPVTGKPTTQEAPDA